MLLWVLFLDSDKGCLHLAVMLTVAEKPACMLC